MSADKHPIVRGVVISRRNLVDLFIVTILLAFGVNLISNYISARFIPFMAVLGGTTLCFGSVLYMATRFIARRIESRRYEAFLVYNERDNEMIPVPRYEFSEQIQRYFRAAFVENPALKTRWAKEPLKDLLTLDPKKDPPVRKLPEAARLLVEATEYFVLQKLSVHLEDYFNKEGFMKEDLENYGRTNIPGVLLSNRFLELFSRPREDRPLFVKDTFEEQRPGVVVAVFDHSGAFYNRFKLTLPKGSTVRRAATNKIEIETKKLKVAIVIRFEGFNTVLPQGFEEYYLRITDMLNSITVYQVNVDVQVSMKFAALFSASGWQYYRWVDSFLEKVEEQLCKDAFIRRIDWESVFTMLQYLEWARPSEVRKNQVE